MATRTRTHASRFEERRGRNELETEVRHIGDLVRLRSILERHGATKAELRSYDVEIAQHRHDLAALAGHALSAA